MSTRWRTTLLLALVLVLAGAPTLVLADKEEVVAFNVESLKYHCLKCEWALKCTKNCVKVTVSEAKNRHGIPCKVCGGTCK